MRSHHLDEFYTLISSLMPSLCDHSPASLFLHLSLLQSDLPCVCVALNLTVCFFFMCIHVFFSVSVSSLSSPLLSLYVRCPLVSANHFWSISEIYGQFYPIIPASFQSLHHPSLYSPSVWSWIVDFSQEDTDALALWQFYAFFPPNLGHWLFTLS